MALYKRAATEKNNPQAMDVVGAMYFSALGVDQNIQTALQWFHRSAMLGDQIGAFFYATLLYQGNKTEPNKLEPDLYNAYKWYKIAATENENAVFKKDAATFARSLSERKLSADQVAKADKEIADWKPVDIKNIDQALGPVPEDPPQAPTPPPAPVKSASPTSSSPLLKSPGTPLPHSDPLPK
jgi:TPR repeat protein